MLATKKLNLTLDGVVVPVEPAVPTLPDPPAAAPPPPVEPPLAELPPVAVAAPPLPLPVPALLELEPAALLAPALLVLGAPALVVLGAPAALPTALAPAELLPRAASELVPQPGEPIRDSRPSGMIANLGAFFMLNGKCVKPVTKSINTSRNISRIALVWGSMAAHAPSLDHEGWSPQSVTGPGGAGSNAEIWRVTHCRACQWHQLR